MKTVTTGIAPVKTSAGVKVALVAITAALYAAGKAITGPIPFAYGVGEVLIAIFIPAFLVVVADTLPVAIGAGIGTFLGDYFVRTTPVISLVAGVPANFLFALLFGLFVKRYRSWPAFVAGAVAFLTLGNLIASIDLVLFLALPTSWILGFVVAWNITGIPAIIVAVPVLVRAVRPLFGRSRILSNLPDWSGVVGGRQLAKSLVFPMLYAILGVAVYAFDSAFFTAVSVSGAGDTGLIYLAVAAAVVIVFGPLSGVIGGAKHDRQTPG
ncbi:MAG TPA: hypothetical protein VEH53_07650 [archaeon]|nr:hypothetical protein [archaeon]